MLHVRIGPSKMGRPGILRFWKFIVAALSVAIFSTVLIQKYSDLFSTTDKKSSRSGILAMEKKPVADCPITICPLDHFSFFVQSGAAQIVPPKICFENKQILGLAQKNFGVGINIAIVNGTSGVLLKSEHYNMYDGEPAPLIEFLKQIELGSIVLMASYDDPGTKLNEEARKLILDMGSSKISSVEHRDNWIFVGGKGANVQTNFEKHLRHAENDKYNGWPELVDISGCIPKYLDAEYRKH